MRRKIDSSTVEEKFSDQRKKPRHLYSELATGKFPIRAVGFYKATEMKLLSCTEVTRLETLDIKEAVPLDIRFGGIIGGYFLSSP